MDLISDPDRREGSKVKWLGFSVVGKSLDFITPNPATSSRSSFCLVESLPLFLENSRAKCT